MHTLGRLLEEKGSNVITSTPSANAMEAATLMTGHRVGALVITVGERVVGMVSERDIMERVVVAGRDPNTTHVGEIMTTPVVCCAPSTTLDEARAIIRQKRIRHLPVIDAGRLVGIVSIGDLNLVHSKVQEETIQYLEQYIYTP